MVTLTTTLTTTLMTTLMTMLMTSLMTTLMTKLTTTTGEAVLFYAIHCTQHLSDVSRTAVLWSFTVEPRCLAQSLIEFYSPVNFITNQQQFALLRLERDQDPILLNFPC